MCSRTSAVRTVALVMIGAATSVLRSHGEREIADSREFDRDGETGITLTLRLLDRWICEGVQA